MHYVLIHGLAPSHLMGNGDDSDKMLRAYVADIVYGRPERIFGTLLATGKFVALVEFPEAQITQADFTWQRMGSFSYGSQYVLDKDIAWREFGVWVAQYSGSWKAEATDV